MSDRIWPSAECKCDLRARMAGDGCEHCNPERFEENLRGNETEFEDETDGE